jgi:hypothetical protein
MSSSAEFNCSAGRDGGSYNAFNIFAKILPKVACHSGKKGFGIRVKIRGSTSERERSRAGCPCHLADDRNAQPLFTDIDPGADVWRGAG